MYIYILYEEIYDIHIYIYIYRYIEIYKNIYIIFRLQISIYIYRERERDIHIYIYVIINLYYSHLLKNRSFTQATWGNIKTLELTPKWFN